MTTTERDTTSPPIIEAARELASLLRLAHCGELPMPGSIHIDECAPAHHSDADSKIGGIRLCVLSLDDYYAWAEFIDAPVETADHKGNVHYMAHGYAGTVAVQVFTVQEATR